MLYAKHTATPWRRAPRPYSGRVLDGCGNVVDVVGFFRGATRKPMESRPREDRARFARFGTVLNLTRPQPALRFRLGWFYLFSGLKPDMYRVT